MIRLPQLPSLAAASALFITSTAFGLTASDDASNYGGSTNPWNDGSNQGTGFANWSLSSDPGTNGFAGTFLGDSTVGAGDINTGGQSFGMFANGNSGSSVEAIRNFSTALTTNDRFTFDFAVNFADGNRGFNLRTGGSNVVGLNISSGGASISTAFTDNPTTAQTYDYGGNDAMLEAVLTVISSNEVQYEVSRSSSQGTQGVLYAGSVTGITGSIDNFNFYINGDPSASGDGDNLYFNNLEVVPEPATSALLLGAGALALALARRVRA